MAVYLPTGAIGNGLTLATLGSAGEIMTFFYPRTDFAQNVRECMPCLYIGDPGHGVFHWTWEPVFGHRQWYRPRTDTLVTELRFAAADLVIEIEDFCPPDEYAISRRVVCRNEGSHDFLGTFMHYFSFALGEIQGKQAVRYHHDEHYVLQYLRDQAISVGGTRPDTWRCGKAWGDHPQSARPDLYDGHLNGQPEEMGEVDFALGWRLHLRPGQEEPIEIFICAGPAPERRAEVLPRLLGTGHTQLRSAAEQSAAEFLARARRPHLSPRLEQAWERALLSLRMLADRNTGSFTAAPEFDPGYERCGGYGYCWPRDASDAAMSLRAAGFPEYLEHLAGWYVRTQMRDGSWAQRYWADGSIAASWALREGFYQLDQTGAALWALSVQASSQPDGAEQLWPTISRAAAYLIENVSPEGWHHHACDLWETFCGTFAYTNAVIHAAFREAAAVAAALDRPQEAGRWSQVATQMREATLGSFDGEYFPRGFSPDGEIDPTVDSSTLGLAAPFGLLDLTDPRERAMVEASIATIQRRLSSDFHGGPAILRFEGESYLGGVIGCVNTLWLALVLLKLARVYRGEGDAVRADRLREEALAYIDFCLDHATPTGLLPELIGTEPDTPYWAAPHGWASGLLVQCLLEV